MSGFNGSGTFNISGVGLPYTSGTVISSSVANTLNTQLAAGLSNCITKDGQQVLTANIPFNNYKITGLGLGVSSSDSANIYNIQCATGTLLSVTGADTIVASATPALASGYVAGMTYRFFAAGTNTGAVTLEINSQGAKAVTKNGSVALSAGDIPSGVLVSVTYDGTRFVLQNQTTFASLSTANITITNLATISGKTLATGGNTLDGGNTLLGTYAIATSGFTNNGLSFIKNRAAVSSTLSGTITDATTTITLVDGTGFPSTSGTILIDNEQITYSTRTGNVLTVSARGANGTAAAPHTNGAAVSSLTFGSTVTTLSLDSTTTTLTVSDTTNFPSSGTLLIDREQITYSGKTSTTFTGATRGANGTVAASHNNSSTVTGIQTVSTSANIKFDDATSTLTVSNISATNINPAVISGYNGLGMRNRIINGNMALDQRNFGVAQTLVAGTGGYTVDRFYAYSTGADVTGQQIQGATAGQYYYQITGAASVTGVVFGQRIESANSADLAGKTVTLSVDLASTQLTNIFWYASYANTTDSFGTITSPTVTSIASGTFAVTSTMGRYVATISVPAAATTGIEIKFTGGALTSGTFTIGNVQLERGAGASAFEYRPIGTELSLAQRYFWRIYGNNGYVGNGNAVSTTSSHIFIKYPVTMRAAPSTVFANLTVTDGVTGQTVTGILATNAGTSAMIAVFGVASGLTQYRAYYVGTTSSTGSMTFSSEL